MHAEIFAIEESALQVCWRGAPPGPHGPHGPHGPPGPPGPPGEIRGAGRVIEMGGGAGAVIIDGLRPGTDYQLDVAGHPLRATTLTPPPGQELARFATFNDMHVGAVSFGTLRPVWEDDPADPHAERCFRTALAEAVAWGAQAVVVKGDATQNGAIHEWETAAAMVASTGLPVVWIEGNHETKSVAVDGRATLAAHGLTLTTGRAAPLDLPGIRIVAVPTARWHAGNGHISDQVRAGAIELCRSAPGPAVVILHHYPQRFRYPTLYPSGIPASSGIPLLDGVARVNPATLVLAGHSHRHRYHRHGPLVVAETGSTKDYPGTWSGYTVYEGGIVQTTRRVAGSSAFDWTERGRRVIGGLWGLWAPGVRSHRCFSHTWPSR